MFLCLCRRLCSDSKSLLTLPGIPRAMFLCLCLLVASSSVLCQMSLLASGPGVLKPSQTLIVTCKLTGIEVTAAYDWSWIRQLPGSTLEWLGHINAGGGTAYPASLQSRLTITRDVSKNEYYLQMSSMRAEETAMYYCVRRIYGYGFDYWGQGTMVTVTSEESTAPHVFPLVNCCPGAGSQDRVNIGCLVSRYLPDPVSFNWKYGSSAITSGVKTFTGVAGGSPGLLTSSSLITVNSSEWKNGHFSCRVEHRATNTTLTKTLSAPEMCKVLEPVVKLVQVSCAESDGTGQVALMCLISSLSTQDVQVKWLENGKEVSLPSSRTPASRATDGTFAVSVKVQVPQGKWNSGTAYTCQATDLKTNKVGKDDLRRCTDGANCLGILVFMLRPTAEDLFINKKARITCLASNLPDSSGASFSWTRKNPAGIVKPMAENPQLHSNGSYSATSVLPVCVEDWDQGETFTCQVKHPKLTSPIVKTISKNLESRLQSPDIHIHGPTSEELARNEMVTITCVVSAFFPVEISMKWTQGKEEMQKNTYVNTAPQKWGENFFMVSLLRVDASAWNNNTVFSCLVVHEAAAIHIIQKSIDKSSGNPTIVNISVSVLDSSSSCY